MPNSNLLTPPQFNEKYTLYVNTAGQPVERTLREMTAAEVLQAVNWHFAEANRLEREAAPYKQMAIDAENGWLDPDTPDDVVHAGARALLAAGEASKIAGLLLARVDSALPKSGLTLGVALHRYWRGGH
jgi:hypothetical protein